jgi:hypothetical protein
VSFIECAAEPVAGWIVTDRLRDLHERLSLPDALLSRTDLAELRLPRRGVDACSAHYPSSCCRIRQTNGAGQRLP